MYIFQLDIDKLLNSLKMNRNLAVVCVIKQICLIYLEEVLLFNYGKRRAAAAFAGS